MMMTIDQTLALDPLAMPDKLWNAALGELELQMTRATFDTWLRGTQAVAGDVAAHTLTVAVKNSYALEWLENRLYTVIERTVQRLTNNGTHVAFIVQPPPPRPDPAAAPSAAPSTDEDWTPPDFDPSNTRKVAGWFPIPEYGCHFWAPLLGRTGWRLWEIIRQSDIRTDKTEWTPIRRWSVPELARLVPCGNQALTGRNRAVESGAPGATLEILRPVGQPESEAWIMHQPGAFDTLQAAGLADIAPVGEKRHRVYVISVRSALPLLHPSQVAALRAELQVRHERWIEAHGMDPELW